MRSFILALLAKRYFLPPFFWKSQTKYSQLSPAAYSSDSYTGIVQDAQKLLGRYMEEEKQQDEAFLKTLVHPYWQHVRELDQEKIQSVGLREDFLRDKQLQLNIGWGGGPLQAWHRNVLTEHMIGTELYEYIAHDFIESRVGSPYLANGPVEMQQKPLTPGLFAHAYYLGRATKKGAMVPAKVLEFGGGYGGCARLFMGKWPSATYCILDTPESLIVQYVYLTMNGVPVHALGDNEVPKRGMVNLVPFWRVASVNYRADLFLSTFALTETTDGMRQEVERKDFFGAPVVYIQGGKDMRFESHKDLPDRVKERRPESILVDSHIPGCYEISLNNLEK
jgi:hypothetical protein